MSSSVREDVPAAPGEDDAALLAEVRHAAGNLVHRMHYWTELLGEERLGESGTEALVGLRSSIDGLHELVARTMDLLRPARVRTIAIPAADLVRSIALRFGADCEAAVAALPSSGDEACVDPGMLDRALTILVEAVSRGATTQGAPNGSHACALALTIERDEHAGALAIAIARAPHAGAAYDPYASVHADLALALAAKLLADTGCALVLRASELRLRIPVQRAHL